MTRKYYKKRSPYNRSKRLCSNETNRIINIVLCLSIILLLVLIIVIVSIICTDEQFQNLNMLKLDLPTLKQNVPSLQNMVIPEYNSVNFNKDDCIYLPIPPVEVTNDSKKEIIIPVNIIPEEKIEEFSRNVRKVPRMRKVNARRSARGTRSTRSSRGSRRR